MGTSGFVIIVSGGLYHMYFSPMDSFMDELGLLFIQAVFRVLPTLPGALSTFESKQQFINQIPHGLFFNDPPRTPSQAFSMLKEPGIFVSYILDLDRGIVTVTEDGVHAISPITFTALSEHTAESVIDQWSEEENPKPWHHPKKQRLNAPPVYMSSPHSPTVLLQQGQQHHPARPHIMSFLKPCPDIDQHEGYIGVKVGRHGDSDCQQYCNSGSTAVLGEKCWRKHNCCYRGLPQGTLVAAIMSTDNPALIRRYLQHPTILDRIIATPVPDYAFKSTALRKYIAYPDVVDAILQRRPTRAYLRQGTYIPFSALEGTFDYDNIHIESFRMMLRADPEAAHTTRLLHSLARVSDEVWTPAHTEMAARLIAIAPELLTKENEEDKKTVSQIARIYGNTQRVLQARRVTRT